MEVKLEQGSYIVAVSGGIDSVVLLDVLVRDSTNCRFVVAHFDHGIRDDSGEDAEFVRGLAAKYSLPFELGRAELGSSASEEKAREARYTFLTSLRQKYNARLVTAHHQDDLLETAIINIIRGTGPHGIVNMLSNSKILRPLLGVSKAELVKYAKQKGLTWHEDYTNTDESYLRNYVRAKIMPSLQQKRAELTGIIENTSYLTKEIDVTIQSIASWLFETQDSGKVLSRQRFVTLDFAVACYVVRYWLLRQGVQNINKKLIDRVAMAAKTLPAGKRIDLDNRHWLASEKLFCQIVSK